MRRKQEILFEDSEVGQEYKDLKYTATRGFLAGAFGIVGEIGLTAVTMYTLSKFGYEQGAAAQSLVLFGLDTAVAALSAWGMATGAKALEKADAIEKAHEKIVEEECDAK